MTQAIDQTIELEKRLLSALMLRDGEAVAEVADVLTANDFYRPEHKKIYSAILRLHAADVALNWLLVKDELLKSGDSNRSILESLDGLSELEYTTARAPYYAERIKTASQLRRLVEIGRELSYSASKGGATTIEVLADVEKKLTAVVDKDMRALTSAEDLATETFDEIMRPQAETAIQTKFRYVDKLTGGGLKKSDLIILAARPGMGKTTFAINIAANVAMNHSVLFFSLEVPRTNREAVIQRNEPRQCNANPIRHAHGRRNKSDYRRRQTYQQVEIVRRRFARDTPFNDSCEGSKAQARKRA